MHRVRQSVNYFQEFDYEPIVIAVKPDRNEHPQDLTLSKTIPKDLKIHWINAFSTSWTRKFGLGSLALRSLWFYFFNVNRVLKNEKIDLIYFSTTMFPVTVLGAYWKWRFNIPYIIDIQDLWHSDYYQDKPKEQQPAKHFFSYRLNKFLEPIAMKKVSGIVSVSEGYVRILQTRYPHLKSEQFTVIPFGAFEKDFDFVNEQQYIENHHVIFRYIGRGGHDMDTAFRIIFSGFCRGLKQNFTLFSKVQMEFIGTSYAKAGKGKSLISSLASEYGLEKYVSEKTDRIPYFEALGLLKSADVLIIPGSDDPSYTASKIYPYILAKKTLLAVFNDQSSVIKILKNTNAGEYVGFSSKDDIPSAGSLWFTKMEQILSLLPLVPNTNWQAFEPYTAKEMTKKQCDFFDRVIKNSI
jgi:hypothetical protein